MWRSNSTAVLCLRDAQEGRLNAAVMCMLQVPFESWYRVLTRHAVVVSKIRRQLDLPGIEARRAEAAAQQAAAKRDGEQGAAKHKGEERLSELMACGQRCAESRLHMDGRGTCAQE